MNTTQSNSVKERKNQIIDIMVSQLGGNRFMVMTGSKPQYKDTRENPMICFKLVRNQSKANFMKLTYVEGLDTYKMEFVSMRGMNEPKTVNEFDGLHAEDLQNVFTSVTGLYTKL